MSLSTEKLNEKALEIAKQFNGLTVSEGQFITRFIDNRICSNSTVNFTSEKAE